MYVIAGATGNTGSVVAETLLDAGKPVRVIARDASKVKRFTDRGAELALSDLSDSAALERAFAGAQGAYLLSPPDMGASNFLASRKLVTDALARAAKAANVGHVVFLSSIGAQHPDGTGPILSVHEGERALRVTGLAVTFVRAAYFMENWAAVLGVAKQDGVLPSFLAAARKIPMVSTRDIGLTAARALLDGPRGTRILELSGPVDVSPNDVAAALSRVLGRDIKVAEAPLDAVVPTFTSFGVSQNVAECFREMYAGFASGRVDWQAGGTERVRGNTSIEEVLRVLNG